MPHPPFPPNPVCGAWLWCDSTTYRGVFDLDPSSYPLPDA